MPQITSWGSALITSLSNAFALFFAAIPRIIAFIIILAIGWAIATLIGKGLRAVLRAIHFDGFVERAGLGGAVQQVGVKDASSLLGLITTWFVRLIVLVVAFDGLGLPAVSDILRQLLLWLPNLFVALVTLVIGGLAANALSRVVEAAATRTDMTRPDILARVAKVAVWAFAIIIAINQIGVASTLMNILFLAVVGAVALALGLSFGLGSRDTAGLIVRNFYERNRQRTGQFVGSAINAANEPPVARPLFEGDQRRGLPDRRNPPGRRATT
ncbi:mechanosensitive ion channel family protein [Massilia horti]|uniref:Small-conductance mechanosensitive ion channel n=1 Tax=Massilia horti TaxID=2562153 RepID=A0A4Y9SZ34_9BURK|nr:small-conductance mechanosensitive ion channel [Massilia horti]TFW32026.1 small-conductance mechanosensitive ion channel [Massilia horti]